MGIMGIHRFPPFEFDSATLRLRKHGSGIRLQGKPALLLAALLEQQGQSLSRKELCSRLWLDGTFVDFDLSLNVAVKKLRDCLGDSADQPKYIQTVAGHGYRFIGKCEDTAPADLSPLAESPGTTTLTVKAPRRLRFGSIAAAAVVLLGFTFVLVAFSKRPVSYRAGNFRQITRSGTEKTPFATDGERIYFFESRGDYTSFTQISVNGGEELRIPASAQVLPYQADVLRDQMVYLDGNWGEYFRRDLGAQVWIRQLPAGTPWQVPDTRCQSVSWTRSGNLLCTRGGEFRIMDVQGRLIQTLFHVPSLAFRAHLSPDEKRIRFDMARKNEAPESNWGIWESTLDGKNLHLIAPNLLTCCGSWSDDGYTYVFETWNGSRWDVWAISDAAGWLSSSALPVQLTSGPLDARYPKPSADGKEVLFLGADFRGELSALDEKTGKLVPYLSGDSITQVDFSPDGKWITYVAYPEGTLWRSRRDGTEGVQLTRPPLLAFNPRFSKDGSRIYFGEIGGSENLYEIPFGGGALKVLSKANPTCLDENSNLFDFPFLTTCPAGSGGEVLRLVDPQHRRSWRIQGSDNLLNGTLSADGRIIAGIDRHSGNLMVFLVESQRWIDVPIEHRENPPKLAWSSKGDSLYLRQGDAILRYRVDARRLEIIAQLPKSPTGLWWGNWFGVSPDGKVMLTRQTGAGDIYAFELQTQ